MTRKRRLDERQIAMLAALPDEGPGSRIDRRRTTARGLVDLGYAQELDGRFTRTAVGKAALTQVRLWTPHRIPTTAA